MKMNFIYCQQIKCFLDMDNCYECEIQNKCNLFQKTNDNLEK
jgi:hypothetical protein